MFGSQLSKYAVHLKHSEMNGHNLQKTGNSSVPESAIRRWKIQMDPSELSQMDASNSKAYRNLRKPSTHVTRHSGLFTAAICKTQIIICWIQGSECSHLNWNLYQ